MVDNALSKYAGIPLPSLNRSFLELLRTQGFDLVQTGPSQKTTRIYFKGENRGYVNNTVVQKGALLGYHFATVGHRSDSCPPELTETLVEWACQRFKCPKTDLVVHNGAGSNTGRTFLLFKSATTALRTLKTDSGMEFGADDIIGQQGHRYIEGRIIDVVSQRRERDPAAREACLSEYGFNCFACGTNLRQRYSGLKKELIQVHHEEPLSQTSGEREFDPIATMKPLCPNCHCVVHSRIPTYTVVELRAMLHDET